MWTGTKSGSESVMNSHLAPKLLTSSRAMGCLAANLLVAPGLGSFMARRPVLGAGQFTLALAGFLFFCAWFIDVLRQYYGLMEHDLTPKLHHWLAFVGIAIFFAAWLWSLFTSLAIFRAARQRERAAVLGEPAPATRLQGDR